jgi:CelD/BcsL family acetyltransferase involved in cellulose biosynthesis
MKVKARVLHGFDDPSLQSGQWQSLLTQSATDEVFLTWHWQRAWWESLGHGKLLLVVAEREGSPVAIAPLYADSRMIFFVGSNTADYLDFIGNISDPEVLDALLETARDSASDFLGFHFYKVLERSPTAGLLRESAHRLGLTCLEKKTWPAPGLDLASQPEMGTAHTRKQSLLRHERYFRREGSLEVRHLSDGEAIHPYLEEFFQQHISRWANTPYPSDFLDPAWRGFYETLTRVAAHTGWLRFTRIEWEGRAIALHYGFCYHGNYLWYKPAFDIGLARRSPGEVLLRQLLLAAMAEGAAVFDFGLGDEPFKCRFATHVRHVRSWGLYSSEVAGPCAGTGIL